MVVIRKILDVYAYDQLRRGPRPDAGDGDESVTYVPSPARSAVISRSIPLSASSAPPLILPCKHPDLRVLRVDPSL